MVSWPCRGGVAPGAVPKADVTGMAPKKSAVNPPMARLLEGFCLGGGSRPISLVNPRSGGLGLYNAKIGGLARRTAVDFEGLVISGPRVFQ